MAVMVPDLSAAQLNNLSSQGEVKVYRALDSELTVSAREEIWPPTLRPLPVVRQTGASPELGPGLGPRRTLKHRPGGGGGMKATARDPGARLREVLADLDYARHPGSGRRLEFSEAWYYFLAENCTAYSLNSGQHSNSMSFTEVSSPRP